MKFSTAKRKEVEKRAKNLCEYCLCRQDYSPQPFSVEHIFPKSKDGSDELENLALACQACNNFKYTKTEAFDPHSQQKVSLYNPRKMTGRSILLGTQILQNSSEHLRLDAPQLKH